MINRKFTLEQRIARLEKATKNEKHPEWSSRIITKETADELALLIKECLSGESVRVSTKYVQRYTDGRFVITVTLRGEKFKFYFTHDLSGNFVVYTYDADKIGEELGRFDSLDETAEDIADYVYGAYNEIS